LSETFEVGVAPVASISPWLGQCSLSRRFEFFLRQPRVTTHDTDEEGPVSAVFPNDLVIGETASLRGIVDRLPQRLEQQVHWTELSFSSSRPSSMCDKAQ
jgi:hypothetical protein